MSLSGAGYDWAGLKSSLENLNVAKKTVANFPANVIPADSIEYEQLKSKIRVWAFSSVIGYVTGS